MKCVHYRDTDGIGRTIGTGWCAIVDDSDPDNIKTACGLVVVCSYTGNRAPTCADCKKAVRAKKAAS